MEIVYPATAINNLIPDLISRLNFATELSTVAGAKAELLSLYEEVRVEVLKLKLVIEQNAFSTQYVNPLAKDLDNIIHAFPRSYGTNPPIAIQLQDVEKPVFKSQQERDEPQIREALSRFRTSFDFFTRLDLLNRDLVIVGANGSGKTFLANDLQKHIKENGIIVSAQRIFHLPIINNIKSHTVTSEELKKIQIGDKTNKSLDAKNLQDEFGILLQNLLADDAVSHREYKRQAHENSAQGMPIESPRLTKLERALNVWNQLFSYPQVLHDDGMNVRAHTRSGSYSAMEMSEGEKVTLFLVAQVLQSPENGFIIVDEPEMYLHPTIHKRLWDKLELERPDSIFIYLTHDLDFASSRTQAKKLWLRSFTYPNKFVLDEIPSNDIPRPLLLELLGSRQNIIFCEGVIGSLDERIYTILFPNHTVKPVGSCLSVINFTKAFNKIPNSPTAAVGIIDADYHSQKRLKSLQPEKVFGLKLAEVENLLFDEAILNAICDEERLPKIRVQMIKDDILNRLSKESAIQISNYVSARVDNYFKDNNVSRGNDISKLKVKYHEFLEGVNIDEWANERNVEIEKIISDKNYQGAIQIFNDKGLESIANKIFKMKDFNGRAIRLLRKDNGLRSQLLNHFPNF